MRIAIGSDHAGFDLKEALKEHITSKGYELIDCGTHSKESTDYPIYAKEVAMHIKSQKADRGILICGSGLGMSISANKIKGIRAALCLNEYMARMSVKDNNANVLCLGGRVIGVELAKSIIDAWFDAHFEGGRHERRLRIISSFEEEGI